MTDQVYEVNFDGLVGPTHNYAGLSRGNLASAQSKHRVSNPRAAALEGLAKMRRLADLGVKQAVLPPHERPDVYALRRLGFSGNDADVLWKAKEADPVLLAACSSASAMWTANAATVSPSADAADGRVHITPANLASQGHRSLEPQTTVRILRAIFNDPEYFAHHEPLPAAPAFGDEGAANHLRLASRHDQPGVELFIYGRSSDPSARAPTKFPARQTREASEAVARLHSLAPRRTLLVQQNPAAIDAGAFHNDVVCVTNESVLLCHEEAFTTPDEQISVLRTLFREERSGTFHPIVIPSGVFSLQDAVQTYLFNSQLVTLPDGTMTLIAPAQCRDSRAAQRAIEMILAAETPLRSVHYVDVRQSMHNGGGPACLRLRVVLTVQELNRVLPNVVLTDSLYARLVAWVDRHYRDRLSAVDLADPALLEESRTALDELTSVLGLGNVFRFQNEERHIR